MRTEIEIESEIEEIVPFFLESRKKDLSSLFEYLNNKEFLEIKKIAHTIKGIARPYGFPTLEKLAKRLEEESKVESFEAVELTLKEIKSYLEQYH